MASRTPSRILVVLLALMQTLKPWGRRRPPTSPGRILIAHHLLLGDTLMLTPLLAKLRERYPQAQVVMTTPKAIAPLYQHKPYGVDAVPYDPRDIQTLSALIKMSGFDLALVPGDNRFSWLAKALGSRWIVAFAGDRPPYKSWPVDQFIPYPDKPAAWGDMVAGLIDGPAPACYRPEQWSDPDCRPFEVPPAPYCVLHVGASSPLKLWENEKWRDLAAHVADLGYRVVWSAGGAEAKYIAAVDPDGRHASYAGQLDLAQLWKLIKNAELLVSPDTGIAHLGRIVGTPTITLFGPGSAVICGSGDFWRDSPYRAVTVEDFPCRDQRILFRRKISWVKRCGRSTRECREPACMQAIGIENVQRAIAALLSPT